MSDSAYDILSDASREVADVRGVVEDLPLSFSEGESAHDILDSNRLTDRTPPRAIPELPHFVDDGESAADILAEVRVRDASLDSVIGAIIEEITAPNAEVQLNAAPAGPTFGTHAPDFGTGEGDLGTGDAAPGDAEEQRDAAEILESVDSQVEDPDFGGDGSDLGVEIPPEAEDEIRFYDEPAPEDLAFDIALLSHRLESEERAKSEHTEQAGAPDAKRAQVVGEEEQLADTAAFNDYEVTRVAAARAVLAHRENVVKEWREWDLPFGQVWGPAGRQTTISITPQVLFRGEKIMATDTGSTPGRGTRIMSVAVGQQVQRPAGGLGTLTQFFAQTALANGIKFDTAHRWSKIAVTVSFVESCTFDMSLFGTAVL